MQACSQDFLKGDYMGVVCVCMHAYSCKTRGVWGHVPLGCFAKLDALRLLLRPFWDRNRAVVATWLAENCI